MKLVVLACMWKRPEIFRLFADGLRRLQDKFDIVPLIVGSEGEASRSLCSGFWYIEHDNKPLGLKYNAGMLAAQKLNPDYVMGMGSDDFISDDTMAYILECCKEGYDLIGFSDMWMYDTLTDRLGYWKGFTARHRIGESMGMARTLSKRVLGKMHWMPRHNKANKGLDWTMTQKLKRIPHVTHITSLKEKGLFAVDVKSKENICSFDLYDTTPESKELLKQIPELCGYSKDM